MTQVHHKTSGFEPANLSNALLHQLAQLAYSGGINEGGEDKRRERKESVKGEKIDSGGGGGGREQSGTG